MTTIEDVARTLKGVDDTARLRTELEAANGGQTAVNSGVASDLQAGKGILSTIMAKADPDVGAACDAYDLGVAVILVMSSPTDEARAQQILDELRQQVDDQEVDADSVEMACAVQDSLSPW